MDDSQHMALIHARHPLPIVQVPFSGHTTIQYFSMAGALARLAEEVVFRRIPVEGLIAKRRALRLNVLCIGRRDPRLISDENASDLRSRMP